MWWSIEPVLLGLHQPPDACVLATRYARYLIIGFVPYLGFEALRRFLQAQGITTPMVLVSVLSCAVTHPLLNYLLIYVAGYGYDGAALAVVTSQWMMFMSLLGYVLCVTPHRKGTWQGWSRQAFVDLGAYVKLAIPGGEFPHVKKPNEVFDSTDACVALQRPCCLGSGGYVRLEVMML